MPSGSHSKSKSCVLIACLVSKLREHWEETSVAVTARKSQLESMLSDSNQFEHRRQDVDQWLGRMETRISKLAPVAGTADLIDAQHREQKVRSVALEVVALAAARWCGVPAFGPIYFLIFHLIGQ
jgi:hypothetical protein